MTRTPLMPKATAVWLVDNTALTFDQIAEFCVLHVLEVKGIADGDVAHGIKGMDPISSNQLSREEIALAEKDSQHKLLLLESKVEIPEVTTKRGPRYTPVSRRQDRPNAILWLLRNHPELKDSQVMRLVGTTKPTILAVRERSHWNSPNLVAQDPVTLGLSSQTDLDAAVKKAALRLERELKKAGGTPEKVGSLLPTEETIVIAKPEPKVEAPMASALAQEAREAMAAPEVVEKAPDADSVFAKLKDLKPDETLEAKPSEVETAEAKPPETETPKAETSEAETPEAETPEAETPEAETPTAEEAPTKEETPSE